MIKQIFTTIVFIILLTTSSQANNLLNTKSEKLSYNKEVIKKSLSTKVFQNFTLIFNLKLLDINKQP